MHFWKDLYKFKTKKTFEKMAIVTLILVVLSGLLLHSQESLGTTNKDTLQLVQVIFRHGDSAPTKFYPNDPYINDFDKLWPEGFAQLTNKGKLQQYELGKFLRQRYDGHLSKVYSQNELYVTSSDMDRTIMSLESNLAGLFPPVVNPWNPDLAWQPIPLRTIPKKEDKFLHNGASCPKIHILRTNFYYWSDVVRKANEEHKDFIQYCAEHSGLEITTVKGLYPLLDILYAQASHNYTLPKWAQGDTLQKLLDIQGVVNTWPTFTSEMKRLSGGPLLSLLLRNMQAVSGHLEKSSAVYLSDELVHSVHKGANRKMLMYSAHDSTLARIMNTMGIFEPHCPPYASALMIELHQDKDTMEYFIEFHYRNETAREPFLLTHPQCGHPCKLQTYLEISNPLIPVDWEKECQLNFDDDDSDNRIDHGDHHENKNVLKGGLPKNTENWFTPESSCVFNPSQLVILGFGLIISSALSALIIVKVLQYQSGNNSYDGHYIKSSSRPFFMEVLSGHPKPFYRSTYEPL